MKKFNVVVTITQEYEVEIDETIYNDQWKKDFEKTFWDLPNGLKDVAKDLAGNKAINGNDFQEGYGIIKIDGRSPLFSDTNPAPGLNINVITHDEDIEYDIREIS